MGPTCFGVRFFVVLSVGVLLLLPLILHTSAALRMIGDPNLGVSLVRKGLCSQWEVSDVGFVWWFFVNFIFLSLGPQ